MSTWWKLLWQAGEFFSDYVSHCSCDIIAISMTKISSVQWGITICKGKNATVLYVCCMTTIPKNWISRWKNKINSTCLNLCCMTSTWETKCLDERIKSTLHVQFYVALTTNPKNQVSRRKDESNSDWKLSTQIASCSSTQYQCTLIQASTIRKFGKLWAFQLGFEQRVARPVAMEDEGRDKVLFFGACLRAWKCIEGRPPKACMQHDWRSPTKVGTSPSCWWYSCSTHAETDTEIFKDKSARQSINQ
jgi:hypothetical protein